MALIFSNYTLVFDGCLRRDNFRHHISQLGFVGQQLVNKIDESMLDLKTLSRVAANVQLSTALYILATFIYYLMFICFLIGL